MINDNAYGLKKEVLFWYANKEWLLPPESTALGCNASHLREQTKINNLGEIRC